MVGGDHLPTANNQRSVWRTNGHGFVISPPSNARRNSAPGRTPGRGSRLASRASPPKSSPAAASQAASTDCWAGGQAAGLDPRGRTRTRERVGSGGMSQTRVPPGEYMAASLHPCAPFIRLIMEPLSLLRRSNVPTVGGRYMTPSRLRRCTRKAGAWPSEANGLSEITRLNSHRPSVR
jgi:hypothetical protein